MSGVREKIAWALAAALGLLVVAALTGVVSGGPLDPSGSPAPTGKTLEEIPGSWSRTLASNNGQGTPPLGCNSIRFRCVLGDTAVLDLETGTVWERIPSNTQANWSTAAFLCHGLTKGGRNGWRLPTIEELMSLWDAASAPRLPGGHPFQAATLSTDFYWAQSTSEATLNDAYTLTFATGVNPAIVRRPKTESTNRLLWCVRGTEHDGQPSAAP